MEVFSVNSSQNICNSGFCIILNLSNVYIEKASKMKKYKVLMYKSARAFFLKNAMKPRNSGNVFVLTLAIMSLRFY